MNGLILTLLMFSSGQKLDSSDFKLVGDYNFKVYKYDDGLAVAKLANKKLVTFFGTKPYYIGEDYILTVWNEKIPKGFDNNSVVISKFYSSENKFMVVKELKDSPISKPVTSRAEKLQYLSKPTVYQTFPKIEDCFGKP